LYDINIIFTPALHHLYLTIPHLDKQIKASVRARRTLPTEKTPFDTMASTLADSASELSPKFAPFFGMVR